jgi:hypothetical protein
MLGSQLFHAHHQVTSLYKFNICFLTFILLEIVISLLESTIVNETLYDQTICPWNRAENEEFWNLSPCCNPFLWVHLYL